VLANLVATLALGAEENMNVPIYNQWVVTPLDEEFEENVNAIIAQEVDEEDWGQPLIDYLQDGKLSIVRMQKTKIQRRASHFLYFYGTLYRCSFLGIWLRCLDNKEVRQTMVEAHSRICGAHQVRPKLYDQIMRMGYYWPTMVQDCIDYAKRCDLYQFQANFIHQPPEPHIQLWYLSHLKLGGSILRNPSIQSLLLATHTSWQQRTTFLMGRSNFA